MRLIAGLLLVLSMAPQDAAKEKPCDMSKVEDGWYCVRCKKILMKTEKKSDLDKEGNCLACSSAPEKAKICLKEWVEKCGMDQVPHEHPCCNSKTCCKMVVVPSLVSYKCEGCEATASFEDKIVHKKADHEKKIKPVCGNSGKYPHGGALEKPKDPNAKEPPKEK